ncbi:Lsr2 family protein [Citricoccus sp. I39-566]|uniref:histone-like nucleoid-structuring protein Lsr2 n=1 Tax=Citricoccus sp. I39-566 TaxID=3073268 RepID=UPI00286A9792|nr:Lsr2 family protein [Citricoccus sp. I39-566]WMY80076.1 Lsr2 family protein [Citricoccus sp. I39-566]
MKTVLVDDLNGEPAVETVQFGVDGRHYELDLTQDNARQLRAELKVYVRAARPVGPPKPTQDAARIRAWARQNGYEVSDRGRIHREVIEAYHQAV